MLHRCLLALLLSFGLSAAASALDLPTLQRLLQAEIVPSFNFQEQRESPWLTAPVLSTGSMHRSAEALEKRVLVPRVETWRLLADRMEWIGPRAQDRKQILYRDVPAVAVLAHALRRVIDGDLLALAPDFQLALAGDLKVWTLRLTPRQADMARHLDHLELQGSGGQLQVIIVVERQAERTTTRLLR
ncbi:MAG: hypothetical protein IV093_15285 [Rubrivivax sp.]|nr:hypothetical protein [Rubrivivax sp.]